MNKEMFNLLAHRCSESKSLVRAVEKSIVIAVVPGGHYKARASMGHARVHQMMSVALSSRLSLHF